MGKIQVLDDHTINQIAAGEVIERPASVVKELVENSLDANAKNIWIRIEEGGTSLVQDVNTSGFRGEALPSIASVSRLRITTCRKGTDVGTRITIEGNNNLEVEEHASPQGTTIEVADLFFNTPARSKHLKRVATELQHIVKIVTTEAIRRPDVAFNLVHGERKLIDAPASDLKTRIGVLLGRDASKELIEMSGEAAKTIVRIAREEKVNKSLREIIKNILSEQALIANVNLESSKTDSIFGTPMPTTSSKSRATPVNSIDSLQQEFDVELNEEEVETNMPSMRPLALIENKYIVAMGLDGLYIIDFHAAHERVMYERLKDQAQFKRVGKQDLLKPISLELSKSESTAFEGILPEVNDMGFDVEKFGPSSFMIRSVPALLAGSEPERIREAIDDIVESGSMKSAEEKHTYMMYTVACHSALRAGDKLTMAQMEFVIREMESIPNPYACVHGRPTVMTITPSELDKKFKRSGF